MPAPRARGARRQGSSLAAGAPTLGIRNRRNQGRSARPGQFTVFGLGDGLLNFLTGVFFLGLLPFVFLLLFGYGPCHRFIRQLFGLNLHPGHVPKPSGHLRVGFQPKINTLLLGASHVCCRWMGAIAKMRFGNQGCG